MDYKPNDDELKKLGWLLRRLQSSEDYCRPYFERAKRYYKLYRFGSAVKADDWPYVNRVRSRDIFAFVEDTTALLIQTLFATMPFFSPLPVPCFVILGFLKQSQSLRYTGHKYATL